MFHCVTTFIYPLLLDSSQYLACEHFFCSYSFCEHSKQVQWGTHALISPQSVPISQIVGSSDMVYSALVDPIKEFSKVVVPIQS